MTCETSRLKFVRLRFFASHTAIAFGGAVVSIPTAKNTTFRMLAVGVCHPAGDAEAHEDSSGVGFTASVVA